MPKIRALMSASDWNIRIHPLADTRLKRYNWSHNLYIALQTEHNRATSAAERAVIIDKIKAVLKVQNDNVIFEGGGNSGVKLPRELDPSLDVDLDRDITRGS